jgi:hypothetical protein
VAIARSVYPPAPVKRFSPLALVALVLLPGCGLGSNDAGGRSGTDDRTTALQCITGAGVDARLEGPTKDQQIVIGSSSDPPHVKFFLTAGEAEAEQFQGNGEGAEQIGGTLLYVGDGNDDLLKPVEKCLADL